MSKMSSSDKLDTRFSSLSSLSGPYTLHAIGQSGMSGMSEHLSPTGVFTATAVPAEGLSESERRSLSAAMAEPALKKTTDPRVDTIRKWLERVGKIHGWSGEFASEHAAGGGPAFSLRLGVQPGPGPVAALRLAVPNSTLARYRSSGGPTFPVQRAFTTGRQATIWQRTGSSNATSSSRGRPWSWSRGVSTRTKIRFSTGYYGYPGRCCSQYQLSRADAEELGTGRWARARHFACAPRRHGVPSALVWSQTKSGLWWSVSKPTQR